MDSKVKYIHEPKTHNTEAAQEILPYIINTFNVKSVIDIGCGNGSWLNMAKQLGIINIKGIDGVQVPQAELLINKDEFLQVDLQKPFKEDSKYDLAICLEVAEHLHEDAAQTIVNTICSYSDVILFSAAIPNQGGQNHLNEQWPDYWQEKFEVNGFSAYDILRDKFWDNEKVFWWYRQNSLIYIKNDKDNFGFSKSEKIRRLVHPQLFSRTMTKLEFQERNELIKSLKKIIKLLVKR